LSHPVEDTINLKACTQVILKQSIQPLPEDWTVQAGSADNSFRLDALCADELLTHTSMSYDSGLGSGQLCIIQFWSGQTPYSLASWVYSSNVDFVVL